MCGRRYDRDYQTATRNRGGFAGPGASAGLDIAGYIEKLVRGQVMSRENGISELSPEEWMREFKAWAHSHDADNLPILSDDAISRESMYD